MKILCFGDSNTYGYDPRDHLGNPYPSPWPSLLARSTGWDVVNLGMNGREIPSGPQMLELTGNLLNRHLPAQQLIILLGTNDLLNLPFSRAVEETASRMEHLLVYLKAHFPELAIRLIAPPKIALVPRYTEMTLQLADRYRLLAETYGISFLDLTCLPMQITADGVHLTEQDHEIVADAIRKMTNNDE